MQSQLGKLLVGAGQRARQFRRARFQAGVEHRGQQRHRQYGQGGDQHQVIQAVATQASAQRATEAAFREVGRCHRGVVHADNRHAHHHRRGAPDLPDIQGLLTQAEGNPQGCRRSAHGNHQRQAEQHRVVVDARLHQQRGHAGVMHAADTRAHDQRPQAQLGPGQARLADQPQGKTGRQPGDQQRQKRQGQVVAQRDRQAEGEHADEVHRPDAEPHRQCATADPQVHRPALGGGDASGQVECGIGSKNGHTERNQHQRRRVTTDQHLAFHNPWNRALVRPG
ncbi:hypothetical protein D3C80_1231160 [compost metagenome]